jgi:hydrogenase/urease accessory protein HupE
MAQSSRRRRFLTSAFGAIVVALLCGVAVRAHEIGTTRVSVVFDKGRTYEIEIVTDAAGLVEKLAAATGRPPAAGPAPEHLQSLLAGFGDDFLRRVTIAFDASQVRPAIACSVVAGTGAASSPVATIRLTGPIPDGARGFTWTYAWTFASYALMVRSEAADNPATEWLEGGQTSSTIAVAARPPIDRLGVARRYAALGFTHIVPGGFDHVLFVLGIYLLSGRARSVLSQVSAFTIAHSLTLGLSLYGVIAVPPRIVEPMIAFSIAYVAIENIFRSELKSWRVALVFGFGLLHGMGFAGALRELGLPRQDFMTALLTFNIGVEAGQLAVIAAAFVLVGWQWADRAWYRARIVVPASALIACIAVYWTFERLGL